MNHGSNELSANTSVQSITIKLTFEETPKPKENAIEAVWSKVVGEDLPEGMPFINGREYICHSRSDSGIDSIYYADNLAVQEITKTVAAAEDAEAILSFNHDFPRLATYFDTLWAHEVAETWHGQATDIDNNHAAWFVFKGLTPTGRIRKYPYEISFNAQDFGQANYSTGVISYTPEGLADKLRMIYWRAGTKYEVVFTQDEKDALTPIRVSKTETRMNNKKEKLWEL